MSATSDIGAPPELAWLPVDKLDVDPAYQRTLESKSSQRLIQKIAAEFNWMKFQALLCTPRADTNPQRWWVVDGQHRTGAATRRGDIPEVPALVFAEASQALQAMAFVGANKDRVAVSPQALFHAQLIAGDQDCATIKRHCDAAGIELMRYNLSGAKLPAGKTAAAPALLRALKLYGEGPTAGAIAALGATFARFHGGLRNAFFLVATRFLYEKGTREALERALTQLGIDKLDAIGAGIHGPGARRAKFEALQQAAATAQRTEYPERRSGTAREAPSTGMRDGTAPRAVHTPPAASVGAQPAASPQRKTSPVKRAPPVRVADNDAIARFLAEKGARIVMSPEQIAAFLRDSGHQAHIRIAEEAKWSASATKYLTECEYLLDGKPVGAKRFYELANELRASAGLKPIALPQEIAA